MGDPLTFTLVLSGSGSLAAVKPPDLGKAPAVAERFKVYEATQKTDADTARFVYSLRPLAEGDEPFPAVAVAYFDVDEERYVTLQSDPIPISITKAERLSGDQIVAVAARGRADGEGPGSPAGRHFCQHHRRRCGPRPERAARRLAGRTGRLPGDLPPGGGGDGARPPADPGQVGLAAAGSRLRGRGSSFAPRRPSGRRGKFARRPTWSRTRWPGWWPTWPACTTPA